MLTPAAEEQCAFASTGYYGGCSCGNTYVCHPLFKQCVQGAGSLSKADCEASCGDDAVEAVPEEA